MQEKNLLVILVLYYNDSDIISFVADQLNAGSNPSLHVLIVNNGSDSIEKTREQLSAFQNLEIIGQGENLGYFGAADSAFKYYTGKNELPHFVIISNSDLEFADKNWYTWLINNTTDFDIAGPSIISGITDSNLNPFSVGEYGKKKLKFLSTLYCWYPLYLLYQVISILKRKLKGVFNRHSDQDVNVEVFAIHGSFMIFRNSFFRKGGHFNYGSFLYGEELFIAALARKHGMKTMYLSGLRLIHHEHTTTGLFKSRKQIRYMKNSIDYLLATFYNV